MPDPATAPLAEIDRELSRLVRRFHVASHVVASATRPEGVDDETFQWLIAAHRARWKRRMEDTHEPRPQHVERVPLRKEQLRKPGPADPSQPVTAPAVTARSPATPTARIGATSAY